MSAPELERAKDKIRAAFADVVHPDQGEIACDCVSKTCEGLAMEAEFKPFSWRNVPAELVDKYAQSLPIFTDLGFQYFLPAYMMRALKNPDSEVWEAVILGLPGSGAGAAFLPPMPVLPEQSIDNLQKVSQLLEEHEVERLRDFTVPQIEAMIEFVEYLVANPSQRTEDFIEDLFTRAESMDEFLRSQTD